MLEPNPQTTPVFAFADEVVRRWCELSPLTATDLGVEGFDDRLDDFSPAGRRAVAALCEWALTSLDSLAITGPDDEVACSVMTERLSSHLELEASGESVRGFGVIYSPASTIRQSFELMSWSSPEGAHAVRQRLDAVTDSLASWRASLEVALESGEHTAARHARGVAEQMRTIADEGMGKLVERVAAASGRTVGELGLDGARDRAAAAYRELAGWLAGTYAERTRASDFVGAERYRRWARHHSGLELDLEETYAWGWTDLRRINERMWELAGRLAPGASSLTEVAERLDADERYRVRNIDELLAHLRALTDETTERLAGREFTIDERVRFCDVRLAPEGSAAAPYYIPPSEDLARPGTTWFPTQGESEFNWWRLVTYWYHEGVPGHHLEGGTLVLNRERLSRFQRTLAWTSGWGEGWALYAERLMDEIGGFAEPALEMGYLVSQAWRAARVVVDIGMHLQLAAPRDLGSLAGLGDVGGAKWTPEMAVATLMERALVPPAMAHSEVDRYLALPGQAISYKVGEREWLGAREEMRSARGAAFSLRDFHDRALALGPMGLSAFREALRA